MSSHAQPSEAEARAIGLEGYTYLYPLITMEFTRRQLSHGPAGARPGRGPMNQLHHIRAFPTADFKVVVRPNFDTLYSSAWIDVSAEPVVVSAPASEGRYFMLPCLDMWSDVFANPGTRTSGSGPISFALCRPGWQGALPGGVVRIDAPTPTVWMIGRTQTNGPADYPRCTPSRTSCPWCRCRRGAPHRPSPGCGRTRRSTPRRRRSTW